MKGLELSKKFYKEYGEEMLKKDFPALYDKVAVGLIGSGSECFGFDDDVSIDHDFEPGFCIFVPDSLDDSTIFTLKRAYDKLPREYEGFKRAYMSPVGGNRHGVIKLGDFLEEKTGKRNIDFTIYDWLRIPEESLAELANGEVWLDESRMLYKVRYTLATFPEEIRYKKLAGSLLLMAQSGQYNFNRCIKHKEVSAARLAAYEFVNACLHVICLLNETYMPYYKWVFKFVKELSWPTDRDLIVNLESLLHIDDSQILIASKIIEEIVAYVIAKLNDDRLVKAHENYLEPYAYDVNNNIKDAELRNMHILCSV